MFATTSLRCLVSVFAVCAALVPTFAEPIFDGKIRKTDDGRYEAYMVPPAKANHASFLELLPKGDLVMAWFSGTAEGANNCSIVLAHLPSGSDQWSNATVVSRRPGYSNQNPVLFLDPTGQILYLFHTQQPAANLSSPEADANIWVLQSFDGGLSWTSPQNLFKEKGSFDRNRIIFSLKGDWIFPIYYAVEGDINEYSAMKISPEWPTWGQYNITGSNYLVQPSVIRPVEGEPHLVAYMRDRRAMNIYKSTSSDDGYTWSTPQATQFANNNAAIQAHVLNNGHLVLVYNPTNQGRVPLRVALSMDGGLTWPYSRDIETSIITSQEFSYPCILQTPDKYIHVTFTYDRLTIKYMKFQESWIMDG